MPSFKATKTFSAQDQTRFAELSKDSNPLHLDVLLARRTQEGTPLVHGMHTVFWCLNELAASYGDFPSIRAVRVRFLKPVSLGEAVTAAVQRMDDQKCGLEVSIDGSAVCRILIGFGQPVAEPVPFGPQTAEIVYPEVPAHPEFLNLEGTAGRVGFPCSLHRLSEAFPHACRILSPPRAASLLTATTLVGMVCPGLHSLFGGLNATFCSLAERPAALDYRVSSIDTRFRLVRIEIGGTGLFGEVESFSRLPPAGQPSIGALAGRVPRHEFAGSTALVVGGSRGLGEVAAKILAAGGANVLLTYATGLADAEAVAHQIQAWGGQCTVVPYNVRGNAAVQLANLPARPTHLYYFATPPIFRRKAEIFVGQRFQEFLQFYVVAFYDIFKILYAGAGNRLAAFYPSSIAVNDRPADMTEYAMAKAAGEVLCGDLAAHLPNAHVVVNRLPRLPTDQTASLFQVESADPIDTLLPIVRDVQSKLHASGHKI